MSDETLTIVLTGTPYGGDSALQALRLAEAALDRRRRVNLFASADGVYAALDGQVAKGLPEIGRLLEAQIARGMRVALCGACLRYRGVTRDRLVAGAAPGTLRDFGAMLREARAVVCL